MNPYLELLLNRKMTLIMSLPANDPDLCALAFDAGADVVKVHINVEHRASGTHFGPLSEERSALEKMLAAAPGPMGIVPGNSVDAVRRDIMDLGELPFSFYSIYMHHMPASLMTSRVPLMLACDGTYSLEEVKRMKACGASVLEASIIPGGEYGSPLSGRDLLAYRQLCEVSELPTVVPSQRSIRPEDVPALMVCGVRAVMIGAIVTGKEKKTIREAIHAFRKIIDEV